MKFRFLKKHLNCADSSKSNIYLPLYRYRQYGLWDRYTDTHPESDQVFTVGVSDTKKDWFFAHVDRSCFFLRELSILPKLKTPNTI